MKELAVTVLILLGFALIAAGTVSLREYMTDYRAEQAVTSAASPSSTVNAH